MSTDAPIPRRGEIWQVNFNPTRGAEIQKERPAVVISSDSVGRLPLKLVAPITEWKDYFVRDFWQVRVDPDNLNGLTKASAVDTLQVRSVDVARFVRKRGRMTAASMEEIVTALAAVIEFG